MIFNKHFNLEGRHAFLSPSKYHWLNYDEVKLTNTFLVAKAAERGTKLHDYAKNAIMLGVKQANNKSALSMYVNDAIGFKMTTEQALYYSDNCFGTADAISFKKNFLRIHDLKTGVTPGSMKQLLIYTSMFCLEYKIRPENIEIELRIYQSDDVLILNPDPKEVTEIMLKIIKYDKQIEELKNGG